MQLNKTNSLVIIKIFLKMKASLIALMIVGVTSIKLTYLPDKASIVASNDTFQTTAGSWEVHGQQLKGRKQGSSDDGEDDAGVVAPSTPNP